jgi:hypothetical protein
MDETFSYSEAVDKPYVPNSFPSQADYSLDDWVMPDNYDRPITSIEPNRNPSFSPLDHQMPSAIFAPSAPSAPSLDAWEAAPTQASFGAAPRLDSAFDFAHPARTASFASSSQPSPKPEGSPTPSLSEDRSTFAQGESSTPPTERTYDNKPVKRSSSPSSEEADEAKIKRAPRKRGRPRINRSESDPTTLGSPANGSAKSRCSRRLPHNQVERKYREGLNAELERLRRAVPTLPQRDSNDMNGPPKPSKATVLASAIDYIKFIEADRDRLLEEIERLRGVRTVRGPGSKLRGYGWNEQRPDGSSAITPIHE